jgi:hypothetical protein
MDHHHEEINEKKILTIGGIVQVINPSPLKIDTRLLAFEKGPGFFVSTH